jgi:hypothetical protein
MPQKKDDNQDIDADPTISIIGPFFDWFLSDAFNWDTAPSNPIPTQESTLFSKEDGPSAQNSQGIHEREKVGITGFKPVKSFTKNKGEISNQPANLENGSTFFQVCFLFTSWNCFGITIFLSTLSNLPDIISKQKN